MWFVVKNKYLQRVQSAPAMHERMMLVGNILWVAALISIVIALIYPIYCSFALGIEIVIDPKYFISVFIHIFIPIKLLVAITQSFIKKLDWQNIVPAIISGVIIFVLSLIVEFGIISASISFAAIYLMLKVTILLFKSSMSARKYSLFLGHFGFGLLAFSIAMNSLLAQEINFVGKIGNQVSEKNMLVKLEDIGFFDGVNYYRKIAIFSIEDQHRNVVTLKPENRLYKIENTFLQEVDIHSYLSSDLYTV